jgi:hypothetical protein
MLAGDVLCWLLILADGPLLHLREDPFWNEVLLLYTGSVVAPMLFMTYSPAKAFFWAAYLRLWL